MSINSGDSRFTFVTPMFNASETLERMLHSLCGQSYDNWRLVLIDDMSAQSHRELCKSIVHDHFSRLPSNPKIEVIWNEKKEWEVANVLKGIATCDDDDIVVRIDSDDWLTDLDCLYILNEAYKKIGCDVLWTSHRWGYSDMNISSGMPDNVNVYEHPWVSSHLKTFRKSLINDVNDENFRGEDGNYIRRAGDQAIFLPILHKAKKRFFLPRVMYHYSIDVNKPGLFQSEDSIFQRDEALFLRKRGFVQ